jgi:hypothetical protein
MPFAKKSWINQHMESHIDYLVNLNGKKISRLVGVRMSSHVKSGESDIESGCEHDVESDNISVITTSTHKLLPDPEWFQMYHDALNGKINLKSIGVKTLDALRKMEKKKPINKKSLDDACAQITKEMSDHNTFNGGCVHHIVFVKHLRGGIV